MFELTDTWESKNITIEEFIKFYNESGHYVLYWKSSKVNRISISVPHKSVIIQLDPNLTGVISMDDFLLKNLSLYRLVEQEDIVIEEIKRFFQKPDAKWE